MPCRPAGLHLLHLYIAHIWSIINYSLPKVDEKKSNTILKKMYTFWSKDGSGYITERVLIASVLKNIKNQKQKQLIPTDELDTNSWTMRHPPKQDWLYITVLYWCLLHDLLIFHHSLVLHLAWVSVTTVTWSDTWTLQGLYRRPNSTNMCHCQVFPWLQAQIKEPWREVNVSGEALENVMVPDHRMVVIGG